MPNSAQSSAAKAMTLEEEIANGTSQIEYVNFDEDEKKQYLMLSPISIVMLWLNLQQSMTLGNM